MKIKSFIHSLKIENWFLKIRTHFLTLSRGTADISKTREISTSSNREVSSSRPIVDSFSCPYCGSQNFSRRGFRQKKLEKVQLYICLSCNKTFTPHITRGKHYPLEVMFDAISIYNLGYSLGQTCAIVNQRIVEKAQQKTRLSADSLTSKHTDVTTLDPSVSSVSNNNLFVNRGVDSVDSRGVEPLPPDLTDQVPHRREPTPNSVYNFIIQPSTLSNWLSETADLCRFSRMREYALKKFAPKEMVIHSTLVHRQLYRYRFHQAKAELMVKEEYQHRKFQPLLDFLEMVPIECPHQYFQEGLRASETPLTFSKTQMIVRAKQNYATKLAAFVLQSVKERKGRHEALQKFMLCNDSVTVATEVPVYITKDDIEHMKTQLGFEIFSRVIPTKPEGRVEGSLANASDSADKLRDSSTPPPAGGSARNDNNIPAAEIAANDLPKLITGHIDILQIRNGQIHILDYKPNAEKEKPIEQLTLYAMALSRLTGLRLFEFKCAWFDERDYFEFYPLHVLYKTKKGARRRKIATTEGVYAVNKNYAKIERIRPL